MYGLRCFILQNAMKAIIAAEKPIYDLTNGKLGKNRFLSSVKTEHVGTSVKILKSTENSTYIAKMNPDGSFSDDDFRILCTTDLHIDEDYELNDRTLQHLADRIADLKPDLVVLTGDCILSKFQQIDAIQFAKMMENIGVYWTYVFGNHEAREEKGS
ncbi:MAG: metallophosphoesterase, partial [Clostridia bacterium]|nr:metallophosphoesterase [Clostridia bacterium]